MNDANRVAVLLSKRKLVGLGVLWFGRGSPSQVKGAGFRSLSRRGSWVRIPPPALLDKPPSLFAPTCMHA